MPPHNLRYAKDDPDGVKRWKERTPEPLQKAIVDVFHGRGSALQKQMVDEWSDHLVHNVPEDRLVELMTLYHERVQRRAHLRVVRTSDGWEETEGE